MLKSETSLLTHSLSLYNACFRVTGVPGARKWSAGYSQMDRHGNIVLIATIYLNKQYISHNDIYSFSICDIFSNGRTTFIPLIRAVTGQRSSPDLCFATKFIKIYDP